MSEQAAIHILVRCQGKALIAECVDSKLSDEMTIQAWTDEVIAALDNVGDIDRVILSFGSVRFMSSSALRALITLRSKTSNKGLELFLCNISAANMEVFKITRLDSLFRITPTEVEAQRAIVESL